MFDDTAVRHPDGITQSAVLQDARERHPPRQLVADLRVGGPQLEHLGLERARNDLRRVVVLAVAEPPVGERGALQQDDPRQHRIVRAARARREQRALFVGRERADLDEARCGPRPLLVVVQRRESSSDVSSLVTWTRPASPPGVASGAKRVETDA